MGKTTESSERPIGRRPGNSGDTRSVILEAARESFASVGFDRATIRSIATLADVDPALVMHYFKNKQNLFVEAQQLPFNPSELFANVLDFAPEQRGEQLARAYMSMLAFGSSPGLSLLRAAATNEDAARMLREFLGDALLSHASTLAPGPNGNRRLALAGAHLVGVVYARQIIGVDVLESATIEELVADIAPAIQTYLDPQ